MITGISFILIGVLFRVLARLKLKEKFTYNLTIPRSIETGGVYKFMRHPAYFGSLLIIIGITFLSLKAAVITLALGFFSARIIEEEIKLKSPSYSVYSERVGWFFPRLWRRR